MSLSNYKRDEYSPFKDIELQDELQKLIETRLSYHESKGFNSTHRAKNITHNVVMQMNNWIELNRVKIEKRKDLVTVLSPGGSECTGANFFDGYC